MNYKELLFNKDKALTFYPDLAVILNEYDKYLVKIGYEVNRKKWKSKQCGLNAAIVVNQINYWNELNEKLGSKKHFKDGYYWTFHAYDKWAKEDFPFWSGDTVRRAVRFLEDIELVISTDEYNTWKVDNTKWYRIDYDKLQEIINIVEKLRKEKQDEEKENEKKDEKQVADTVNADCCCVMASCTDGLDSMHKPVPEITNRNYSNIDYSTENTDKYALEDKKQSSKGGIYASVPEEQEAHTAKKQNRYIPQDYTEEQLVEHIKQPICDYMKKEYGGMASEEMSDELIKIVMSFHREYEGQYGKRHRVLSDKAYENIVDRYMNPPEEMVDDYSLETYEAMMERYFEVNYNQRGKYNGNITLGLSHFMSDNVRNNLYCQTCK